MRARTLTLAGLNAPLLALRLVSTEFGHLPAPDVSVSAIYPDRLELLFHDDLAGFEQWRCVLGIAQDAVVYRTQFGGRTLVLAAEGVFAGAVIVLTAFADQPHAEDAATEWAGGAA
ncbi:hypothetical protein [Streptomyces fradiae]|uniref:hypothetical protein n=1 Tax=Streptomyces fradiae TaxID=1906 RepID=UPI00381C0337